MCFLSRSLQSLLFMTLFYTFSNGQVAINKRSDLAGKPKLGPGRDIHQNVHCGLQDKAGNLWFGTTSEGVYRYDGKSFIQFTTRDGLSSNTIWSMLEDKNGMIWFGTANGICRFDGEAIHVVSIPLLKKDNLFADASSGTPAKTDVWSIMQDKSGKLWFATTSGVYIYQGSILKRFFEDNAFLAKAGPQMTKVEYVLEDKAGNFWFGGRGNAGIFRFDGKSFTNFKPKGDNWAWPVLEDNQGNIWFSSWNGAYRYNGKTFTMFTKKEGLCSDNFTRIIRDKKGNLWFGSDSENGGLCRYDGKSFQHFTTKDGLPHNSVWLIFEDKTGNLWVGTRNTGLSRYDGKKFSKFSE